MRALTQLKLTHSRNRLILYKNNVANHDRFFVLQQSYCRYATGSLGAEITGMIQVASGNENDLQTALAYVGPISVAVDASSAAFRVSYNTSIIALMTCMCYTKDKIWTDECWTIWLCVWARIETFLTQYYAGGVYNSIRCSRTNLNHAMLVIGFGSYNRGDYYLVKNRYSSICMYVLHELGVHYKYQCTTCMSCMWYITSLACEPVCEELVILNLLLHVSFSLLLFFSAGAKTGELVATLWWLETHTTSVELRPMHLTPPYELSKDWTELYNSYVDCASFPSANNCRK